MSNIQHAIYRAATHDLRNLLERTQRSSRPPDSEPEKSWTHETEYKFADGTTVALQSRSVDAFVIPAAPGITALYLEHGDDDEARRERVIGWVITFDQGAYVEPILMNDPFEGYSYMALEYPDGTIEWRGGKGTLDDWLAHVRERQAAMRAEHEKRLEAAKPCEHCGRGGHHDDDSIPF